MAKSECPGCRRCAHSDERRRDQRRGGGRCRASGRRHSCQHRLHRRLNNGVSDGVFAAGPSAAVINAGTISGAHASVAFGGVGAFTLTLQTGSTLNGDAIGSTFGTNALILQGHGTANNNFVNFTTLNATGDWTLAGNEIFSGGASVAIGALTITGTFNAATLDLAPPLLIPPIPSAFIDTGAVTITGNVGNAGHLTINGVTMTVGGTFTQLPGGTTTLLGGGVLDPPNVVIEGGVFGGSGKVDGEVSVTGGTVQPGAEPGGSLTVKGDYSQTGGEIVFEVDPNPLELGGFLETTLIFDPGYSIGISDTTFVFDFLDGANANLFVADGLLNLNTFLGLTDGGQFCTELNCGTVLQDISFADNAPGFTITGFDPITGAMSTQAVPEPGTWALLMTGFLSLGGLGLRRRTRGGPDVQGHNPQLKAGGKHV